jgi:hypothetical protein
MGVHFQYGSHSSPVFSTFKTAPARQFSRSCFQYTCDGAVALRERSPGLSGLFVRIFSLKFSEFVVAKRLHEPGSQYSEEQWTRNAEE